jgi:hypothetical protein
VGGIVGAGVGIAGIPEVYQRKLMERPHNIKWLEELGKRLAVTISSHRKNKPVRVSVSALLVRNLIFLIVVLFHGFRRLFPPY